MGYATRLVASGSLRLTRMAGFLSDPPQPETRYLPPSYILQGWEEQGAWRGRRRVTGSFRAEKMAKSTLLSTPRENGELCC